MTVRFDTGGEPVPGYRLLGRLGSGGFGEVWKCEAPGGIFKAVKVIHGDLRNRDCDTFRFAEQEMKSLQRVKQVRHPYLLALDRFDVVEGRLLIVMELADCNLWDRFRQCRKAGLPGIPRDELQRYMRETAEVLDLFDDQFQLQHLDIKPQNLFLLHNHVKVADFGQVKDLQGMMAQVTGGITPVYAAPETFDGFVSRYCDQYSLACVYQELLTGVRPFDGGSFQQLLMQHLQAPPNLQPSPAADRPALLRALAKKPEDRFASVGAMVRALQAGPPATVAAPAAGRRGDGPSQPAGRPDSAPDDSNTFARLHQSAPDAVAVLDPPTPRRPPQPVPLSVEVLTDAPPRVDGPGVLRPTLVVGLGFTGMRVLQRLRRQVADRFGPADRLPCLRTVLIDTDPDALQAATQPAGDGLAGLDNDMVVDVRLNRATHYLNPHRPGCTRLDEWMDPQLLYKLPRVPVTLGLRAFGRLAFLDHQRAIEGKLQAELDAALDPQALADTAAATGLEVRTNRPKVVVVAGLAGGTGSGMLFDLAYLVRHKLLGLGYADPEVVAVLHLPAADLPHPPQTVANAYAALTELNHYARPDTAFASGLDDRPFADPAPPFSAVYLMDGLPHPPAAVGSGVGTTPFGGARRGSHTVPMSGVRPAGGRKSGVLAPPPPAAAPADGPDPALVSATLLRLDLLSPVGRAADDYRPPAPRGGLATVRTAHLHRWAWPRAEVVARVGRVMAPVLLHHWVTPDQARSGARVGGWATGLWGRLGLDPDNLQARFRAEAGVAAGRPLTDLIAEAAGSAAPRGWLSRGPDPTAVAAAVGRLVNLLGRPQAQAGKLPAPVEESLAAAADAAADDARAELAHALPELVENPHFRLAAAEEAARRLLFLLGQAVAHADRQARQAQDRAVASLDQLAFVGSTHKNLKKQTAAGTAALLAAFPAAQLDHLLHLATLRVYHALADQLKRQSQELTRFRQALEGNQPFLALEAEEPAGPPAPGDLLPPGCTTLEEAAQTFLRALIDDDLTALDARVQAGLERAFGGLYQACLNTADGPGRTLAVLRDEARLYLDGRLGEADLAAMVRRRFGSDAGAADGLARGYDAAAPKLVPGGPWAGQETCVFAAPPGDAGEPLRRLAAGVLPANQVQADTPDEAVVLRELAAVPLTAVPHLGPAWRAGYDAAEGTPHARADVIQWADVDAD